MGRSCHAVREKKREKNNISRQLTEAKSCGAAWELCRGEKNLLECGQLLPDSNTEGHNKLLAAGDCMKNKRRTGQIEKLCKS